MTQIAITEVRKIVKVTENEVAVIAVATQGPAGAGQMWGDIGGDIQDQSDLQNEFATKEPVITAGTTNQYWRGDKTWQSVASLPISTAVQAALDAKQNSIGYTPANDTNVLHLTGNETAAGNKTFTGDIEVQGQLTVDGLITSDTGTTINNGFLQIIDAVNDKTLQVSQDQFSARFKAVDTGFVIESANFSDIVLDPGGGTGNGKVSVTSDMEVDGDLTVDGALSVGGAVLSEVGVTVNNNGARNALNRLDASGTVGFDFKTADVYDWAFGVVDSNSDTLKYTSRLFGDTLSLLTDGTIKARQKMSISDTDTTPAVNLHVAKDTGTNTVGELARFDARQGGSSGAYATFRAGGSEMGAVGGFWSGTDARLGLWVGTSHTLAVEIADSGNMTLNGSLAINGASDQPNVNIIDTTGGELRAGLDTTHYVSLIKKSTSGAQLKAYEASGSVTLDIDAIPNDGTSAASVRLFRNVNTTNATTGFSVYAADGTSSVQSFFGAKGNSYFNAITGSFMIGKSSSPLAVFDVAGNGYFKTASGDALTVDSNTGVNSILRMRQNGTERGAIYGLTGGTDFVVRAQSDLVLTAMNGSTAVSMRYNATGLGIGRTPSSALDIQSSATGAVLQVRNGSAQTYASLDNSNTDATPNGRLTLYRGSTVSGTVLATSSNGLFISSPARVDIAFNGSTVLFTNSATSLNLSDAVNLVLGTATGTKIGSSTSQKLSFWNATPVVQQVLATGASKTVDDVISLLQTLGLCRQS